MEIELFNFSFEELPESCQKSNKMDKKNCGASQPEICGKKFSDLEQRRRE